MQKCDDLKRPAKLVSLLTAKMFRCFMDGPTTVLELQHITGLSLNTVRGFVRALRKENVVYISDWEVDSSGKHSIRVYSLVKNKRNFDVLPPKKDKAIIAQERRDRTATKKVTPSLRRLNTYPERLIHVLGP